MPKKYRNIMAKWCQNDTKMDAQIYENSSFSEKGWNGRNYVFYHRKRGSRHLKSREKSMRIQCKIDARKRHAKSMENYTKMHCRRRATPPHPRDTGHLKQGEGKREIGRLPRHRRKKMHQKWAKGNQKGANGPKMATKIHPKSMKNSPPGRVRPTAGACWAWKCLRFTLPASTLSPQ